MPSEKRQRQRERGQARREATLTAHRRRARRRQIILFVVIAGAVIGFLFLTGIVGGGDTGNDDTEDVAAGRGDCPAADGEQERRTDFAAPPPMCIDPSKQYEAVVETDLGSFTIALDAQRTPNTVNNFVVLARHRFYEGVPFHRVIPDFVVQGGDPQGTGAGGPGYQFPDERLPGTTYQEGSIAMANAGTDTNGSQFFVVLSDEGGQRLLDAQGGQPKYTLFGRVIAGMDVVKQIETDGGTSQGNGTDLRVQHQIQSITIVEK